MEKNLEHMNELAVWKAGPDSFLAIVEDPDPKRAGTYLVGFDIPNAGQAGPEFANAGERLMLWLARVDSGDDAVALARAIMQVLEYAEACSGYITMARTIFSDLATAAGLALDVNLETPIEETMIRVGGRPTH